MQKSIPLEVPILQMIPGLVLIQISIPGLVQMKILIQVGALNLQTIEAIA